MSDPCNPWTRATSRRRDYLTPEDITAAILSGADKRALMACVLEAIGKGQTEDPKLCAFVSLHGEKFGYERPRVETPEASK